MESLNLLINSLLDNGESVGFPSEGNPVILTSWKLEQQRMGLWNIEATFDWISPLDSLWDGRQYVEFRGEKYIVQGQPSSSKSLSSRMYSHSVNFISEKDAVLGNVYFYDAVSSYSQDEDAYRSNTTKFAFYGTLYEYVARLGESLAYRGLPYTVELQDGIETDAAEVSFEDQTFMQALQKGYEVYGVPFYYDGKKIIFGYTDTPLQQVFGYGHDRELKEIGREDIGDQVVTRCTGTGSADNIPYYYPNDTPKGALMAEAGISNKGVYQSNILVEDPVLFSDALDLGETLTFDGAEVSEVDSTINGESTLDEISGDLAGFHFLNRSDSLVRGKISFKIGTSGRVEAQVKVKVEVTVGEGEGSAEPYHMSLYRDGEFVRNLDDSGEALPLFDEGDGWLGYRLSVGFDAPGNYSIGYYVRRGIKGDYMSEGDMYVDAFVRPSGWKSSRTDKYVPIAETGLQLTADAVPGDTITQVRTGWITPTGCLMPPVYRESGGAERFYKALDNTYPKDDGTYYSFGMQFNPLRPVEAIQAFDDIKPTIEGVKNASGQLIGQFLDIAFDLDDRDQTDDDGKYVHLRFFVKLPKMDGPYGFNLFEQAVEGDTMALGMTSGICAPCKFKVQVGDDTGLNVVIVDKDGELVRDESGNVVLKNVDIQEAQNDTINNEVWIALEKDTQTFGTVMPSQSLRPKAGDTFVITGIKLPQGYVLAAEERLEKAILDWMEENSRPKPEYSLSFSDVYLAQNPSVVSELGPDARIQTEYDGKRLLLYVSDYTFEVSEGNPFPKVRVTLKDSVSLPQGGLQRRIGAVQDSIRASVAADVVGIGASYFMRKDLPDNVPATPTFLAGLRLGSFRRGTIGAGGALSVDSDGSSRAEVDFLTVRKNAVFSTVTIQEAIHAGGKLILSPASMTCIAVEEKADVWRCRFSTEDGNGRYVFNEFQPGDLAFCQSFFEMSSRYYWRLVTSVGDDWIDLSKDDCDSGSGVPQSGDEIVQLGNKTDASRQSAQILSSFGDGAPSYIVYNGIDSYSLAGKNIAGIVYNASKREPQVYCYGDMFVGDRDLSNPAATFMTFQQKEGDDGKKLFIRADVQLGAGSSGLTNLEEWAGVQEKINKAISDTDVEYYLSDSRTELVGGSWSTDAPQWTSGKYIWTRTSVTYADGSKSYTQAVCITGDSGAGTGITSITEYYYLSESPAELVGGSWSTTAPQWEDGKYIWTKSALTYTDGSTKDTDPICVTGPSGKPGNPGAAGTSVLAQYSSDAIAWHPDFQEGDIWMRTSSDSGKSWTAAIRIKGIDGAAGQDGRYNLVQFAKNTSTTTPPESGWGTTPPTASAGEYVWMRQGTVFPPESEPSSWGTPVRMTGDSGSDGQDTYLLDLSNENTSVPCDYNGTVTGPMPQSKATVYCGMQEDTGWSFSGMFSGCEGSIDSDSGVITITGISDDSATVNVSASKTGISTLSATFNITKVRSGAPGSDGDPGSDGKGVSGAEISYQASDSGVVVPDGEWSQAVPDVSDGQYLWTRIRFSYTDGTYSTAYSVSSAGGTGPAGIGIESVTEYYLASDSPAGITSDSQGWTTAVQSISESSPYLWNYESTVYTDGTIRKTDPVIIGTYGRDGTDGTDGVGIASVKNYYFATANGAGVTSSITGWTETIQTITQTKRFLWNYEKIEYTNGKTQETEPCIIGVYGDKGNDGKGIQKTEISYQAGSSGTEVPEGEWSDSIPAVPEGSFLWTRTVITYTDGEIYTFYSVGKTGTDGTPGADAVIYYLLPSADKVTRSILGDLSPQALTCEKYRQIGNGQPSIDTDPSVAIKYSRIGTDSSEIEYSGEVAIAEDTTAVVFTLYKDNMLIDRERVPVLSDASDLEIGSGNLLKFSSFSRLDGIVSTDSSYVIRKAPSSYDNNGGGSVEISGTDAMDTSDAVHTVSTATVYYARTTTKEAPDMSSASWKDTAPLLTPTYRFMFVCLHISYSNGDTGMTGPVLAAEYRDGQSMSITPYYLASDKASLSGDEEEWSTNRPSVSSATPYLYVYFSVNYSGGGVYNSEPIHAACYKRTGVDLLLWNESFEVGKNLILTVYARGDGEAYIGIIGAITDILASEGSFITQGLSSGWKKFTLNLGRITSVTESAPSLRMRFSHADTEYYLNTPMLEYGTIPTDWVPGSGDINQQITDIEYLKKVFPNNTLEAGALIAEMAVVTDSNDNVVAGLNGTETGRDSEHGKVFFFSGSTGVTDEEIDDSVTKIYEDGTVYTKKLIATESGDIGPFSISAQALEYSLGGIEMRLNYQYVEVNRDTPEGVKRRLGIYGYSSSVSRQEVGIGAMMDYSEASGLQESQVIGISSSVRGVPLSFSLGALWSGSFAFYSEAGLFAGLRPLTRIVDRATTLSELDFNVLCNTTGGGFTLKMPTARLEGQTFLIMKNGNNTLTIDGNGTEIERLNYQSENTFSIIGAYEGLCVIVWCEDQQRWWAVLIETR